MKQTISQILFALKFFRKGKLSFCEESVKGRIFFVGCRIDKLKVYHEAHEIQIAKRSKFKIVNIY